MMHPFHYCPRCLLKHINDKTKPKPALERIETWYNYCPKCGFRLGDWINKMWPSIKPEDDNCTRVDLGKLTDELTEPKENLTT